MQPLIQAFTLHIKTWMVWSESCKIPHAKRTYKTNGFLKKTTRGLMGIWAHRWLQKSFKYLFKVSHGWLPHCLLHKNTYFPNVFLCCSCGAIIALLSCKAYLTWLEKILKMPFWLILLPTAAKSVFGPPKNWFLAPPMAPSGSTGRSWDALSGRDPSMWVPASL